MPAEGVQLLPHDDLLSFEEIVEFVKLGVSNGITKVRLTGGEPLVRNGIVNLVRMLADIDGITDLAMTTNGILLDEFAAPLAKAGLHRVNVSLDTVNSEKYGVITRGGDILKVLSGIESAVNAGLNPVKINCVVFNNSDELDALEVAEFAKGKGLTIRFIHQMNLKTGHFSKIEGGEAGECRLCNRIRLLSNGMVNPCLFNSKGYSIRELGNREALMQAIQFKPQSGSKNESGRFSQIGG